VFLKNSFLRLGIKKKLTMYIRSQVKNDPELADALVPKFEPGCKRMTPSDHYLKGEKRQ
jgi:hypothetical protein